MIIFKRNKKGSLQDLAFVATILFFGAMMILFGYKFMDSFNTQIQGSSLVDANSKAASTELLGFYPGVIDNSFLLLAVGISLLSIVLAAMVRVSPIFLVLYLIAFGFIIMLCGVLSNVYQELAGNAEMTALADNLTFITGILTFLPIFVGVFGGLLAIVMFKSWSNAQ